MSNERFIFSDLTAEDKKTGLVWTRDANIAGREMNWNEANDFITQLNKQRYAGYNDWRLPNVKEFSSLIDYSQYDPALPSGHPFTNVQAYNYWSSSTYAYNTTNAWNVGMGVGNVNGSFKTGTDYVWPVRAGQ